MTNFKIKTKKHHLLDAASFINIGRQEKKRSSICSSLMSCDETREAGHDEKHAAWQISSGVRIQLLRQLTFASLPRRILWKAAANDLSAIYLLVLRFLFLLCLVVSLCLIIKLPSSNAFLLILLIPLSSSFNLLLIFVFMLFAVGRGPSPENSRVTRSATGKLILVR